MLHAPPTALVIVSVTELDDPVTPLPSGQVPPEPFLATSTELAGTVNAPLAVAVAFL